MGKKFSKYEYPGGGCMHIILKLCYNSTFLKFQWLGKLLGLLETVLDCVMNENPSYEDYGQTGRRRKTIFNDHRSTKIGKQQRLNENRKKFPPSFRMGTTFYFHLSQETPSYLLSLTSRSFIQWQFSRGWLYTWSLWGGAGKLLAGSASQNLCIVLSL